MKLYFYTLIILCYACSLDVISETEISGDGIINTTTRANSVLSKAFHSFRISPDYFTPLTEDLQPSYLISYNQDLLRYYNWNDRLIQTRSAHLWETYYNIIAQLNVLLESEKDIINKGAEWNYIKGNALVFKAYLYFDLLQLYCNRNDGQAPGIIAKQSSKMATAERLNQTQSVTLIREILSEGISLMAKYPMPTPFFLNENSAKILQLQVELYKKEYLKVETLAKELLPLMGQLQITANIYENLWRNNTDKETAAIIWSIDYKDNPNKFLIYDKPNEGDYLYVSNKYIYHHDDIRYRSFQFSHVMKSLGGIPIERRLLGKYRNSIQDQKAYNLVMYRSADPYFILIESLLGQHKDMEALELLNGFLGKVNSRKIDYTHDHESLLTIFRTEKQKEFIGEKINYFDLKRWNTGIVRYTADSDNVSIKIDKDDYRWTWPIPLSELRYNKNISQNSGWFTIQ
ncbi:RagB/SusD family nutrient uptake outer membrane protein [Sphingobacterium humi]|nr:RagB/SusD family nutrient uptake outer membrane protein [Sphingobacterium humi]